MNYENVYNRLIEMCRATSPRQRLMNRNMNDIRNINDLYTEIHHIQPRSLGGSDNEDNLIEVLPEEHLFLHQLRYKIFDNREDMLAVRFMLNGFVNKEQLNESVKRPLTSKILKGYAWMRHNSAHFRKVHGWQTEDGRKSISSHRKGTMPVVCSVTGDIIGSVDVNHPKVLSGEWVHHSKGHITVIDNLSGNNVKITTDEYYLNKHLYSYRQKQDGSNNGNYSGITDDEIIDYAIKKALEHDRIIGYGPLVNMARSDGLNFPKSLSNMRFNGEGIKNYIKIIEERTNMKYNKFYRSVENKKKISETLRSRNA